MQLQYAAQFSPQGVYDGKALFFSQLDNVQGNVGAFSEYSYVALMAASSGPSTSLSGLTVKLVAPTTSSWTV